MVDDGVREAKYPIAPEIQKPKIKTEFILAVIGSVHVEELYWRK